MKLDQVNSWLRTILSHKYFPILVLLLVNLMVGSLVVVDYGQSRDEHLRLRYAEKSLSAYFGESRSLGDEKGAFYVMIALVGSRLMNLIRPDWLAIEAWHFMHFLAFLMGLFFLYRICLRLVGKWAAFAAVLLFNTQPLLWGHAFINPKDTPFMAFFLASVDMGLDMATSLSITQSSAKNGTTERFCANAWSKITSDWGRSSRRKKLLLTWWSLLSLTLVSFLIVGSAQVQAGIADLVRQAYSFESSRLLTTLFYQVASNASQISVDLYVQKALNWYPFLVVLSMVIFLAVNFFVVRGLLPGTMTWLGQQHTRPFGSQVRSCLGNKKIIAASIFLGLCTAIRVAGPLSGLLVGGYLLLKIGRKAIPALVVYFSLALVVTYLFWPALWKSPLQQFTLKVADATDFPWDGKVMFAGIDYPVAELPRRFVPTLLSMQFTESVMLMFLVGVATAIYWCIRRQIDWVIVTLVALWLAAPVIYAVVMRPVIYDNFRHFLFVIPPIFIFAAIGFQGLYNWIKRVWLSNLLVVILLLPGLYWSVQLHPYQYIYYNSLVGGVPGAFRKYEMDYWATSYRAAIEYINQVAPPDSKVIVLGTDQLVTNFARPDLQIDEYRKLDENETIPQAYVILTSRHNKDLDLYPEAPQLFSIERAGVILAVVKQIGDDELRP